MKKLNIVMLVCAVAVTALLVVSLSVTSEVQETKQTPSSAFVYSSANTVSSQESSPVGSSALQSDEAGEKTAAYLVKTYHGEIGIFRVGEEAPFRILNVQTASLPTADQQLLSSGISVQSAEELQQIVEDYIS
ncbi:MULTISPECIES: BofC C-terminal domain-containing protein [Caproicibacterium]|uniref:Bypass of forespore C C-terminal domain-containing protein n=1 Tax=Caproicibacterium argilliputei TaxID=3030016 RepID=A0AA97H2N7_9FIRM|nr:hypothetical protein [Caproicibacterium argilliputei]WOC31338.1 hypothetical protein PXC00_08880 [Caproicibacterium argilliputei]